MSYTDFILPSDLEYPRSRPMNDDPNDDFVAIDFEIMTAKRTSACAIGMVRVIDGHIVQRFYSLINPIRDANTDSEPNFRVHGIKLCEAEKAPTFDKLFPLIQSFIGDLKIVCHNAPMDINVLGLLMQYYKLEGIDVLNHNCTYRLTGLSLKNACEQYGIILNDHHDALADAEACALVYLHIIGKPLMTYACGKNNWSIRTSKKYVDSDGSNSQSKVTGMTKMLDDNEIISKESILYNAKVVITGVFNNYPDRKALADSLQKLGATIHTSVTKKVDIVIVGAECGPKKIEKIKELQEGGSSIRMMFEVELCEILNQYGL